MIKLSNASLRRGTRLLFEQVNLSVHAGQRLGLTGANGAGKSSLIALLTGELHADSGDVLLPKNMLVATVEQEVGGVSISALEFVIAGDEALIKARKELAKAEEKNDGNALAAAYETLEHSDAYTADARAAQLLAGLGFSDQEQSQAVNQFSGGWRMRLNLARTLMRRSDILLLDEPTNHLDLDAIIWLESWLQRYTGVLLLVSHDRDFLDRVCTHIAHIEQQKIGFYIGNYSAFEKQRVAKLAGQQAAYKKQQETIAHMQKFVDRFKAKATKAKQAQSRLKALSRLETIAPAHIDSPFSFSFFAPDKNPQLLLTNQNITLGYGDTIVLSDVNLRLESGDRIGLLGANGTGKSTLIKSLANTLAPISGHIESAKELNIGYFAQHQLEQLRGDDTPLSHLSRLYPDSSEGELRKYLGGFGFSGDMAVSVIAPMSGGEKARLVLATVVRQKPNLLLLDEPTNHLDLEMRHALGIALQGFEGAMLLVSHDRHLLESVTDELWLVRDGGVQAYDGDLDEYAQWLLKSRSSIVEEQKDIEDSSSNKSSMINTTPDSFATELTENSAEAKKQRKRIEADQRKKLQPLTLRSRQLEKHIERLEKSSHLLDTKLTKPELYEEANKAQLKQLMQQQGQEKSELESLESEWMEINEQLENAQTEQR